MKNKILERRATLEAALETLHYKIKTLNLYYSREQVRCWYIQRNKIVAELKALPTAEQVAHSAKHTTSLIKSLKK